jgi:hypothetical protein
MPGPICRTSLYLHVIKNSSGGSRNLDIELWLFCCWDTMPSILKTREIPSLVFITSLHVEWYFLISIRYQLPSVDIAVISYQHRVLDIPRIFVGDPYSRIYFHHTHVFIFYRYTVSSLLYFSSVDFEIILPWTSKLLANHELWPPHPRPTHFEITSTFFILFIISVGFLL